MSDVDWPPVPTEYPVELSGVTPKLAVELRVRGWAPVFNYPEDSSPDELTT